MVIPIYYVSLSEYLKNYANLTKLSPDGDEIDFQTFLVGLSHFNSPGRKDEKMKTAFRLHDFDDDGVISMEDLKKYVRAVTHETLEEEVRANNAL